MLLSVSELPDSGGLVSKMRTTTIDTITSTLSYTMIIRNLYSKAVIRNIII